MAKRQSKPKVYYIVNPSGAIHNVSYEHAKIRLRSPGWRVPTKEELDKYKSSKVQVWDDPIGTPWNPEPEPDVEPEEV